MHKTLKNAPDWRVRKSGAGGGPWAALFPGGSPRYPGAQDEEERNFMRCFSSSSWPLGLSKEERQGDPAQEGDRGPSCATAAHEPGVRGHMAGLAGQPRPRARALRGQGGGLAALINLPQAP